MAVNAGAALDAKTQAVFCSIWLDGLSDLSPDVLRAALSKTLRECPYWPVKVADIRKHVSGALTNATAEAAEESWNLVLDIRRTEWNPDIPGPLARALAKLPESIRQAARAAGVFREHDSVEALHVWAKNKFVESFTRYAEGEQEELLLPDGEIKNLLTRFSNAEFMPKLLQAPQQPAKPALITEERLRLADQLADAARKVIEQSKPIERTVIATDEDRKRIRYQAEIVKAKYPDSRTTDPALLQFVNAVSVSTVAAQDK